MKLTDLDPRWCVEGNGRRGMGVTFNCPHCGPQQRLAVWFANPLDGGAPVVNHSTRDAGHMFVTWPKAWQRTGDTFETLTLSPSVDASAFGHWHGFIQDGQVT